MKKFRQGNMYKWEVLLLLWMAYLLNQGDRQVFNTVLPAIRDSLNLTVMRCTHSYPLSSRICPPFPSGTAEYTAFMP